MNKDDLPKYMLTTGKLAKWLQSFPEDTLVYAIEMNTGDLQELPDIDDEDGNHLICTMKRDREHTMRWLTDFYKDKTETIQQEYDDMYKYVDGNNGVVIRL